PPRTHPSDASCQRRNMACGSEPYQRGPSAIAIPRTGSCRGMKPRPAKGRGAILMYRRKGFNVFGGTALLWLAVVAALALIISLPAMAAPPTGYSEAQIGPPPSNGSTAVNGNAWTITASGNDYNGATADQLYFVYQSIQG